MQWHLQGANSVWQLPGSQGMHLVRSTRQILQHACLPPPLLLLLLLLVARIKKQKDTLVGLLPQGLPFIAQSDPEVPSSKQNSTPGASLASHARVERGGHAAQRLDGILRGAVVAAAVLLALELAIEDVELGAWPGRGGGWGF
jgi:hypothetical protein